MEKIRNEMKYVEMNDIIFDYEMKRMITIADRYDFENPKRDLDPETHFARKSKCEFCRRYTSLLVEAFFPHFEGEAISVCTRHIKLFRLIAKRDECTLRVLFLLDPEDFQIPEYLP